MTAVVFFSPITIFPWCSFYTTCRIRPSLECWTKLAWEKKHERHN